MRISMRKIIDAGADRKIIFWQGYDLHPRLNKRRRTVTCSLVDGEVEVSRGVAYLRPGSMMEKRHVAGVPVMLELPPDRFDIVTGRDIAFEKAIKNLVPRKDRAPYWHAWLRLMEGLVLDPPVAAPQLEAAEPATAEVEPAPAQIEPEPFF